MGEMTVRELAEAIWQLDPDSSQEAAQRQGQLTKPSGSLGRLETLSLQLAGILGRDRPRIAQKAVIVAAGDHGVVAQGVSAYPQSVTAQMVKNFLAGGAAVSVMAKHAGVRLVIVDAGVAGDLPPTPGLRSLGIGKGTADISKGPAMTRGQAEKAIIEGAYIAQEISRQGVDLIGLGDMGIGNSTSAAAVVSAVTGERPENTTGRGTGRTDAELQAKIRVVQKALDVNKPRPTDSVDVLAKVGGFEIAVLAGAILGAAEARRPVVLDGFITGAAALIAASICPLARDFMIASHRSPEAGHGVILDYLRLKPLLDLDLRLGEGTGAVLAMGIVEAAAATLREMATFEDAGVANRAG